MSLFANSYAAEHGVTAVEASLQLSHADEALKVKEAAEAKFPDTFGGCISSISRLAESS